MFMGKLLLQLGSLTAMLLIFAAERQYLYVRYYVSIYTDGITIDNNTKVYSYLQASCSLLSSAPHYWGLGHLLNPYEQLDFATLYFLRTHEVVVKLRALGDGM